MTFMARIGQNQIVVVAFLCVISLSCLAQEKAKVVSSTPVVKQFTAPQQVCANQTVNVVEPKTGTGAVVGALSGGVIGNAVGSGAGKAASTALGMVAGAVVGNSLEGQKVDAQNVTTCTTQNTLQSTTVYQVVYEIAGKQYSVEMPQDPGPFVMVQLNPVVQGQTPPPGSAPIAAPPPGSAPTIASTLVAPATTYIEAPYPYVYPYAYPYGYVPPVAIGFGFYRGCCWGRRHW
jgi:uncharacterized protein YcfJ